MMIIRILTCLLLLAIFMYCFFIAIKTRKLIYKMTHPTKFNYEINTKTPYTYKKFDFITRDGIKLSGIDYQPKTACKGTILVFHFLGGSKEAILMFVDFLLMNGYRILSFDNRNHGESDTAKKIKVNLRMDLNAFYEKIKSMGIEGPFGAMGFSMGATQAFWAMDEYDDINAVVIDSGPLIYVKKYFNYVLNIKKIKNPVCRAAFLFVFLHYIGFTKMSKKTINVLKNLNGKNVLMIHGEKDNIITLENAKLAYELVKSNNASIWLVPHSRHLTNKYLKPKEYEERIVEFFNKNIAVELNYEKNSSNIS